MGLRYSLVYLVVLVLVGGGSYAANANLERIVGKGMLNRALTLSEKTEEQLSQSNRKKYSKTGFYRKARSILKKVKDSKDREVKRAYWKFYNEEVSVLLQDEQAAYSYLTTELCYMYMPHGQEIRWDVNIPNIFPDIEHPTAYKVKNIYVDVNNGGLVAYRLVPKESTRASIILFEGTSLPYLIQDRLKTTLGYPPKLLSDLDKKGLGYTAFEQNKGVFIDWVKDDLRKGRQTILTGHSLGGVFALRLMGELIDNHMVSPYDVHKSIKVITFSAPGVETGLIEQLIPVSLQISQFHKQGDIVAYFGEESMDSFKSVVVPTALPLEGSFKHSLSAIAKERLNGIPAGRALLKMGGAREVYLLDKVMEVSRPKVALEAEPVRGLVIY